MASITGNTDSDLVKNAKETASSAKTAVGEQTEKVTTAAGGVQKSVGEYVDKAADHVHSKPDPPAEPGVFSGVAKAAGDAQKTVGDFVSKAVDYVTPTPKPDPVAKTEAAVADATKAAGDVFKK
ncbi:unnamed protein product [Lathyrus oleraceus]|uniref:Uncharacterized protein n=1 Tax=Pisum sativum TaxID=3888 RepID=A0A9D4VRD4_PEA|nr:hypothetical protein KIW84_073462 [Pisum sativum]